MKEIDKAILEMVESAPKIARRFAVSQDAILRHKEHIPEAIAKAEEVREVAATEYGGTLLDRLKHLSSEALSVIREAKEVKDFEEPHAHLKVILTAVARLEKHLELEAKLLGELKDAGVNITINQGAEAGMLARLIDAGLCVACRGKIVEMERAVTGEWRSE